MPGGSGQNILVKRFLNSSVFRALYEEKLKIVYEKVFVSGAIDADIERYVTLICAANVDERYASTTAYDLAVQTVRDFVMQRRAYLQGTELLKQ
jgi:spore coat protein CotH